MLSVALRGPACAAGPCSNLRASSGPSSSSLSASSSASQASPSPPRVVVAQRGRQRSGARSLMDVVFFCGDGSKTPKDTNSAPASFAQRFASFVEAASWRRWPAGQLMGEARAVRVAGGRLIRARRLGRCFYGFRVGAAASAAHSSKQFLAVSQGCRQHPPVRVLIKQVKSKRARVRHASTLRGPRRDAPGFASAFTPLASHFSEARKPSSRT